MLGVVSAFHPSGVAEAMRWVVALVAAPVLFWAVTTAMLGVSRHIYTLAINRQIPSWLGKLSSRHATPQVAIAISGAIAIGLVVPTNVKLLAGIYAFGATLAITIAQLSILRLRVTEPDRPRPFGVPWNVSWGNARLPVPALLRGGGQRPRLPQRARLPRHRPLGRRRLDGLRPALLRRLPQGLRGDDADQAGLGDREGADQAGAGARLPQASSCRSSAPSSTTTSSPRRGASPPPSRRTRAASGRGAARPHLRDRGPAHPAARRAAAPRARGARPGAPSSGPARSATSTRTSRSAPR